MPVRSVTLVLAVLATVLLAPATAASGQPVGTVTAGGSVLANPRAAYATWSTAPGRQVIQPERGGAAVFDVPADCVATAAAADIVTFDCGQPSSKRVGALDVATGAFDFLVVPGPEPAATTFDTRVTAAGTHWLYIVADAPIVLQEALLNRATGTVIAVDPFGPRRQIDLDAESGSSRLCRGLRRDAAEQFKIDYRYGEAQQLGRYALGVFENRPGHSLYDCKTRRFRQVPGSAEFNGRYSATARRFKDPAVTLTRLRDRKRIRLPGENSVAFSRAAAWTTNPAGRVAMRRLP